MTVIETMLHEARQKTASLGNRAGAAVALCAFQAGFALLLLVDWRHGVARAVVVAALLAGLVVFGAMMRGASLPRGGARPGRWMGILLAIAVAADLGMAGFTLYHCIRFDRIPLDQGQSTWRAARLLWQAENPYGTGAVVDYTDLPNKTPARAAAGLLTDIADADLQAALRQYDLTLDPALRQRILPVPAQVSTDVADELAGGGYKYGPVIVLVTAALAPIGSPAVVVILSSLACFALFWVVWRLLRKVTADPGLIALGLLAVLLDRHISRNYLNGTATDVWPLLFDGLAVLAYTRRRPYSTALALALAVGSKLFPSLLIVPLLFKFRRTGPIAAFAAASAALYLPWLIWDPVGLLDNALLWPVLMGGDTTSWLHSLPPSAAILSRAVALMAIGVLWLRYLAGWETRLFWTLALTNGVLLLTGGVFHNNYVPWCSIWVVLAIVEAFAAAPDRARALHAAADG